MRPLRLVVPVLAASSLLGWQAPAAPPPNPFAFFRSQISISLAERAAIDRDQTIVRVQSEKNHRISVFTAVPVQAEPERLIAWIGHIAQWKKNPAVLAIGRFSVPATVGDLDGLSLDSGDVDALRSCRPDDCSLKLAPADVAAFHSTTPEKASAAEVQAAFRRILVERVNRYAAGTPARSFDGLWDDDDTSVEDEFTYWSKEHLSGKPIISATHVRVLRGRAGALPEVIVDERQVFATHYITESASLIAMLKGRTPSTRYLAYFNRSQVDVLGGLFGGLIRMGIDHRLRSQAPAVLRDLRRRLESGGPVE